MDAASLRAVIFDYGNTIIEFGPRQVAMQHDALHAALEAIGPYERDRVSTIRDRQIRWAYHNDYRESALPGVCAELLREAVGIEPTDEQVACLVETRYRHFVDCIVLPDGVRDVLERLSRRYRLAMVSNYPCGRSIRDSLAKIGILDLFEHITVSGDVGWCKPAPQPFQAALDALNLRADQCVYVGDNWLADVQGAKRLGMAVIHTSQYQSYEKFEPQEGDHQPDARIARFDELLTLLKA